MEGVQAEKEGDEETAPDSAREALQEEQDEDGIQGVEADTGEMMAPDVEPDNWQSSM